jgi:hypothetical protein
VVPFTRARAAVDDKNLFSHLANLFSRSLAKEAAMVLVMTSTANT